MGIFDTAESALGTVNSVLNFGSALGVQGNMGLNPHLFVTLQDKVSGTSVKARIISYSISNQAEWANKFEGTDGDSKVPILSAILQSGMYSDKLDVLEALNSKTLITKAQSIQVWSGLQPQNISMELEFRAFSDPVTEVEAPIQELLKMMSPVLKNTSLDMAMSTFEAVKGLLKNKGATAKQVHAATDGKLGETPSKIAVSLFGKRFSGATYRIESMEESVDEVRIDSSGNRIYQVVSLSLGSSEGITKSDVISPSGAGSIMSMF
ncbi:hypothetical protein [Sulfurovum sp.]|uniref:hypothetical protein n=1 Tax=Sulfurovum sp. TaxID=1969726 RepID=UPI0025F440F9|nr:hypothetical protein [Sulfurovum sp.]